MQRKILLACLLAGWFGSAAARAASDVPSVVFPRVKTAPVVDGDLSDPAWQTAARLTEFKEYKTGAPAKTPTTVQACYDDQALYLAFICAEPDTTRLKAEATGPQTVGRDDCVEVFIQPGHATSYYHFLLNSKNVRCDQRNWGGKLKRMDYDYQADWTSATKVKPGEGWIAEMAIPWYAFAADLDQGRWSVQFCRQRRAGAEEFSTWSFANGNFHNVDRFGDLATPQVDFSPYRGFQLHDVQVKEYEVTADGYAYVLQGFAEYFKDRTLDLAIEDRPAQGASTKVVTPLKLTANQPAPFAIRLAVPMLGDRKVIARFQEPGTGRVLYVNAFGKTIFPNLLTGNLDRNFYDTEPELKAVFRLNVPRLAAPLFAEVKVNLPGGAPLTARAPIQDPARTLTALDLAKVPLGTNPVTLRVVDAQDRTVAALETILRKEKPAPSGVTVTKVDRDRQVMLLNGQPFFPFGFIGVPADQIEAVAKAGFNTVMSWGRGALATNMPPDKRQELILDYINRAYKAGLYFIEDPPPFSPYRWRGKDKLETAKLVRRFAEEIVPLLAEQTGRHPATIGYQNIDEPEPNEDGKLLCGMIAKSLVATDPYHVRFTLFCSAHIPDWQGAVWDIPQRDIYPRENTPMIHTYREVRNGVADADRQSVPFFSIPLLDLSSARHTGVTGPQQTAQGYLTVIAGAKGILWWIWPPRHKDNWAALQQLAREFRQLAPMILEPAPRQAVHYADYGDEDTVKALVKVLDGKTVLITANASTRALDADIRLPEGYRGQAVVLFEDRQVPIKDLTVTDSYEPLSRHVYELEGAWPAAGILSLAIRLRPAAEEKSAATTSAISPTNLLSDPGFETGRGWTLPAAEGQAQAVYATDTPNSGQRALSITRGTEKDFTRVAGEPVRLEPSTRYTFGGSMKAIGGQVKMFLTPETDMPAASYIQGASTITAVDRGAGWDRYVITFTTQNNPLIVRPVCEVSGKGSGWFDDLSLHLAAGEGLNYIPNSGFEQIDPGLPGWPEGWNPMFSILKPGFIGQPDSPWTADSAQAWEGKYSLRMRKDRDDKLYRPELLKVLKNVPEGPMVYSFYARAEKPDTTVTVLFRTPEYKPIPIKVPDTWKRFVFPFTLGPADYYGRRYSYLYIDSPGTVWIDAVQLERGTEATPYQSGPEYLPSGR